MKASPTRASAHDKHRKQCIKLEIVVAKDASSRAVCRMMLQKSARAHAITSKLHVAVDTQKQYHRGYDLPLATRET